MQERLIQAVGQVYQAASASPVVSTTLDSAATGGLLQSPDPALGGVDWSTATAMSPASATVETPAFLLVASGIKNFKL